MNDARGFEKFAEAWDQIARAVRYYDVIDGELLSVHYHDMSVREID